MAESKTKQPEKKAAVETKEVKPEAPKTTNTTSPAPQQKNSAITGFILIALLVIGVMFIFGWGPFNRSDRVGEAVDLKGLTVADACTKAKEKGWSNVYVTVFTLDGGDYQSDCNSTMKVTDFELDSGYCWGVNASTEYEHSVCLTVSEKKLKEEEEQAAKEAKKQEASKPAEEKSKEEEVKQQEQTKNTSSESSSGSSTNSTSNSASSEDQYTIPSSELTTGLAACARALTNKGYNNVNMPASSYVRGYTAAEPYKWYLVTKPTYKDKTFGSNIQLSQVVCLYNWKTGDAQITYINK